MTGGEPGWPERQCVVLEATSASANRRAATNISISPPEGKTKRKSVSNYFSASVVTMIVIIIKVMTLAAVAAGVSISTGQLIYSISSYYSKIRFFFDEFRI